MWRELEVGQGVRECKCFAYPRCSSNPLNSAKAYAAVGWQLHWGGVSVLPSAARRAIQSTSTRARAMPHARALIHAAGPKVATREPARGGTKYDEFPFLPVSFDACTGPVSASICVLCKRASPLVWIFVRLRFKDTWLK